MKKYLLALAVSLLLAGLSLVLSLGSLGTTVAAGPPPTGTPRPVSAWGQLPPTRTVASSLHTQSGEGEPFYAFDFQTYDCFQAQHYLPGCDRAMGPQPDHGHRPGL